MGVDVADRPGSGVKVGVAAPDNGVALSKASTVWAAAVLATSSLSLDGRLHALKNKVMMISVLNKRVLFFIFSPS
jgi:hypothetical protein